MNCQKILDIKRIAKEVFKHNYVNLGFGGSCLVKESSDYDVILILHDFYPSQIKEFIDKCNVDISPCVITDFQAENVLLWPTKALVMVSKGVEWAEDYRITTRRDITRGELATVVRRNLRSDLYATERKLINGDLSMEKAFNFLRQLLMIICP